MTAPAAMIRISAGVTDRRALWFIAPSPLLNRELSHLQRAILGMASAKTPVAL
jgi:hypothetical protein